VTSKAIQFRVGVFTLAAIALGALVLVVFGGFHLFQHRDRYVVDVHDSVLGLETGAGVYFDGIEVGRVESIAVSKSDLHAVRIEISVAPGTPVRADTVAYVSMAGLTGLKTVDLRGGSVGSPRLPPGGTLAAGQSTLDKLQKRAEELADRSAEMMQHATVILDSAQRVVANLERATDPKPIAAIEASTEQATRTLADASHSVVAMIDEDRVALRDALGSLDAASHSANDVLSHRVSALVDNANQLVGDLRGVVQGNATEMRAAMLDLRSASQAFEELAREVRDRPSRLLFSQAPHDRRLP
jgi:phospholipid/cholesterol/gamma-HCH transport system substrate-binding protein